MPRTSGQVISNGDPLIREERENRDRDRDAASWSFVARDELVEQHLDDRRGRHREDGADHAEQLAADAERDDHRDRAEADLTPHDLRHEHRVFELLLDDEEHGDADRQAGETVAATRIAGIAERIGPTIGIISPMAEMSAST